MRFGIIIMSVLLIGNLGCNSGNFGSSKSSVKTAQDTISYAYGMDIGKNLSQQDLDISPEAFKAGLKAGQDGEAAMSDQEIQKMLVAFQTMARQKQMEAIKNSRQNPAKPKSKVKVGMEAPEIALPTPDGETLKLSDLRGQYVLIDFWASWCKPCRAENPNVVRVYNEYKDKGFEILGVSLDRNKQAWVQAIQKDGLTWPHISDLGFWKSEAAQTYGVSSIPYTVLVDKEGKIIAENLRGGNLEVKLQEIFGS